MRATIKKRANRSRQGGSSGPRKRGPSSRKVPLRSPKRRSPVAGATNRSTSLSNSRCSLRCGEDNAAHLCSFPFQFEYCSARGAARRPSAFRELSFKDLRFRRAKAMPRSVGECRGTQVASEKRVAGRFGPGRAGAAHGGVSPGAGNLPRRGPRPPGGGAKSGAGSGGKKAAAGAAAVHSAAGRRMRKRLPRPGSESTSIVPPWPSTIFFAMGSPRPVPWLREV